MIQQHWEELTAVALLGTDRRPPPPVPAGHLADLLADLAARHPAADRAEVLLHQVAATTVLRRAARLPRPATVAPAVVDHDSRPPTPPGAEGDFRRITAEFPAIVGEWLEAVAAGGWRLGAELVVPVLVHTRRDPTLAELAHRVAGPVAAWLVQTWPGLAPRPAGRRPAPTDDPLPVTPELAVVCGRPPGDCAAALAAMFRAGTVSTAQRAMLINLVARLPRPSLLPVARALDTVDGSPAVLGLAAHLAALARLRQRALTELDPR